MEYPLSDDELEALELAEEKLSSGPWSPEDVSESDLAALASIRSALPGLLERLRTAELRVQQLQEDMDANQPPF